MSSNPYHPRGTRLPTFVRLAMPVVAFHLLGSSALGQTRWTDGTGTWSTAANWSAGVPTAAVRAEINHGGTAQLFADVGQAMSLFLGTNAGESGRLEVFSLGGISGELTFGEFLAVGNAGNGEMRISGRGAVTSTVGIIGSTGIGTVTVTGVN